MCMTLNEKVWSLSNDPSIQCIHRICNIVYPCQGQQSTPPKKEKNLKVTIVYMQLIYYGMEVAHQKPWELVQSTTLNNVLQKCFIDKIQWKILMTGVSTMKFPTKQARMLMASHKMITSTRWFGQTTKHTNTDIDIYIYIH